MENAEDVQKQMTISINCRVSCSAISLPFLLLRALNF